MLTKEEVLHIKDSLEAEPMSIMACEICLDDSTQDINDFINLCLSSADESIELEFSIGMNIGLYNKITLSNEQFFKFAKVISEIVKIRKKQLKVIPEFGE